LALHFRHTSQFSDVNLGRDVTLAFVIDFKPYFMNDTSLKSAPPFIAIRNLRKSYTEGDDQRTIFADLTLDINRGAFVALLGQSGSGKSTLLNLLGGIDLPDAGQIQIDGRMLTDLGEVERTRFRRRHIGFVFQFFNLIPTLTVEENLLLPLELNGLTTPEQQDRALELLDNVGLGNRRHSFPERLSGGEQQRLAIARALVHGPLLLLADEPTGNLDAATGERILELLLNLHRRAGTTIVMVTHSREVAARADRVLYLDAGNIRELQL
jgi:putative ABC transport system ATP-binding protein